MSDGHRFSSAYQTPILWSVFCLNTTGAFRFSSNQTDRVHVATDTDFFREQDSAFSKYKYLKDKSLRQQMPF